MVRWCMPVGCPATGWVNLLNQCDELGIRNQFEVEVLSYGHLPLAYSARCFTASFGEDRPKDGCETCCIKYYPNGRDVFSQSVGVCGNGIQTMSGYVHGMATERRG